MRNRSPSTTRGYVHLCAAWPACVGVAFEVGRRTGGRSRTAAGPHECVLDERSGRRWAAGASLEKRARSRRQGRQPREAGAERSAEP